MKYRTLGRTGQRVSEIGFGAWAIGGNSYGTTRDEESLDALQAAWDHGVSFFDTADVYGEGHSEELIGKFLQGKRKDAVIATKVGYDFYHGAYRRNLNAEYIRFAIDESLKRLQTDFVDLYQFHNPTLEDIERGEIFQVMEELKSAGKIRFYGVSVHTPHEALAVIANGKPDTLQLIFNLIDQRSVAEVFPKAEAHKIGIIAREPFACGLLTGKYTAKSKFPKNDHRNRWDSKRMENDLKKVDRIRSILQTPRLTLVRAGLEFILSFEAVSVVIPGAKRPKQILESILASEEPKLRIEEISILRNLFEREPLFQSGFFRN